MATGPVAANAGLTVESWAHSLAGYLTITPISWDVIGLDSNNVNVGPNIFLVGARVCAKGNTVPLTNVVAQLVFDSANPYINSIGPSTLPPSGAPVTLAANACFDFYFNVAITRTTLAYNSIRKYRITAIANEGSLLLGQVATPTGRQLYVEKLISQNRNGVNSFTGPTTVSVGQTYQYTFRGFTATAGYEQIQHFPYFPVTLFQLLAIQTTYSAGGYQPGGTNDIIYGNACGWDPDPASPTYRSCIGPCLYGTSGGGCQKAGGDLVTIYTVKILGPGPGNIVNLVHDFSGSSYHYNSDYGMGGLSVTAVAPPVATTAVAKSFSPNPINQLGSTSGDGSTMTIVLSNAGAASVTGASFVDALPTTTQAVFGAIASASTVMTVTSVTSGTLAAGQLLFG